MRVTAGNNDSKNEKSITDLCGSPRIKIKTCKNKNQINYLISLTFILLHRIYEYTAVGRTQVPKAQLRKTNVNAIETPSK